MDLEKYKQDEETRKNRKWKAMTSYQKHMCLMYAYRLKTVKPGEMLNYLETIRFINMNICMADLPDFISFMKPEQLRDMAYEVIGERMPA